MCKFQHAHCPPWANLLRHLTVLIVRHRPLRASGTRNKNSTPSCFFILQKKNDMQPSFSSHVDMTHCRYLQASFQLPADYSAKACRLHNTPSPPFHKTLFPSSILSIETAWSNKHFSTSVTGRRPSRLFFVKATWADQSYETTECKPEFVFLSPSIQHPRNIDGIWGGPNRVFRIQTMAEKKNMNPGKEKEKCDDSP